MKQTLQTIAFLTLLFSCQGAVDGVSLFYSDGTPIQDSATSEFVLQEFDSIFALNPVNKQKSSITTSLTKPEKTLVVMDSVRNVYIKHLKSKYSEQVQVIEKLAKHDIFNVQYVAVENQTGRIVQSYGQDNSILTKNKRMFAGETHKFLSFLFALEREYAIDDEYVAFQPGDDTIYLKDENGALVLKYFCDGKASLKDAFSRSYGDQTPSLPTESYTKSDWEYFAKSKKLQLDIQSKKGDTNCVTGINFPEFIELFLTLRNGGVKQRITSIEQIEDENGNSLHLIKPSENQILDRQTTAEMLKLLDYFTFEGKGKLFSKPLELDSNELVLWGRNQNYTNWVVYSGSKHTIGLVIQSKRNFYNPETKSMLSLCPEVRFEPTRMIIPVLFVIRSELR
jgi:hypothetical protein